MVAHGWLLAGVVPENETASYLKAAEALNVRHLHGAERAQTWIARNMRNLNEMLWAERRRETCIACAQKTLGIRKSKRLPVPVPEHDSRHELGTAAAR